tara:strand:+ start:368 stop:661 length:294 start_codon:yes stop_codon:yes gene_type:complete
MELLIDILGLALFVNFLLHWFTPIQSWREHLVEKMVRVIVRFNLFFAEPLLTVFTCVMCLSFWSSLLYFQNFTYALITSFVAVVIEKILKYGTQGAE